MSNRFPTVGVIGAGHAARLMVAPATALGINLVLFASSPEDPGAQITHHRVGDIKDREALKSFASECDIVTYEAGLVPLSVIKGLEQSEVRVFPRSETVSFADNVDSFSTAISDFDTVIAVIVARSPHGQATSWVPTETVYTNGICTMTISPAQKISPAVAENAQRRALEIAQEIGLVGVMAVEMRVQGEELSIHNLSMGPHHSGTWTIDGSRTSQYEQHLRAILDLPLGDPSPTHDFAVTGNIVGGGKSDMYRPYLHLMARNPDLKFHQYRNEVTVGSAVGHITAVGADLEQLTSDIEHAVDYMVGVIDE